MKNFRIPSLNLILGSILVLFFIIFIYLFYNIEEEKLLRLLGQDYKQVIWTVIASTIAVLTFSGYFFVKYFDERNLRSSLRNLLAQELLENLKRSFYGGAELDFQTVGFYMLKTNPGLVKRFDSFYYLSNLYIDFDYCISYPKENTVSRNRQRLETGIKVINYLSQNTTSNEILNQLVEISSEYQNDDRRTEIVVEGTYRDRLLIASKSLSINDLFKNLKKHLVQIV